ncbi:hypothetical protein ACSUZJ_08345 [Telluria sp. B2]
MNDKHALKSNCNGDSQVFGYRPPHMWNHKKLGGDRAAMIALLEQSGPEPVTSPAWLTLVLRLPPGLRKALAAELAAGNEIAEVSSSGWPQAGSVVVAMQEQFTAARHSTPPGVAWSSVNDPRSWRQELCETSGDVEFLLIW